MSKQFSSLKIQGAMIFKQLLELKFIDFFIFHLIRSLIAAHIALHSQPIFCCFAIGRMLQAESRWQIWNMQNVLYELSSCSSTIPPNSAAHNLGLMLGKVKCTFTTSEANQEKTTVKCQYKDNVFTGSGERNILYVE